MYLQRQCIVRRRRQGLKNSIFHMLHGCSLEAGRVAAGYGGGQAQAQNAGERRATQTLDCCF